jgi:hypothetical protein
MIRADSGSDSRYDTSTLAPTSGGGLRASGSVTDTFRPSEVVKVKTREYIVVPWSRFFSNPLTVPVVEIPFS